MIDTKAVKDRRPLRFASIDEAIAEARRVAEADAAGRLGVLGNWSLGRILGHLAFWANAPFDGYPELRRPPAPLRMLIRLMKGRFLEGSLPPGFRIPGTAEGTLGTEDLSTGEGLERLVAAFTRLRDQDPRAVNPVLGPLRHEEWIKINLRHAELHLGYAVPRDKEPSR